MSAEIHILPVASAGSMEKREARAEWQRRIAAICKRATGVTMAPGFSRVELFFKTDVEAQELFNLLHKARGKP